MCDAEAGVSSFIILFAGATVSKTWSIVQSLRHDEKDFCAGRFPERAELHGFRERVDSYLRSMVYPHHSMRRQASEMISDENKGFDLRYHDQIRYFARQPPAGKGLVDVEEKRNSAFCARIKVLLLRSDLLAPIAVQQCIS
jgi:hypothetical protein